MSDIFMLLPYTCKYISKGRVYPIQLILIYVAHASFPSNLIRAIPTPFYHVNARVHIRGPDQDGTQLGAVPFQWCMSLSDITIIEL